MYQTSHHAFFLKRLARFISEEEAFLNIRLKESPSVKMKPLSWQTSLCRLLLSLNRPEEALSDYLVPAYHH
jgi:hypothetical protein